MFFFHFNLYICASRPQVIREKNYLMVVSKTHQLLADDLLKKANSAVPHDHTALREIVTSIVDEDGALHAPIIDNIDTMILACIDAGMEEKMAETFQRSVHENTERILNGPSMALDEGAIPKEEPLPKAEDPSIVTRSEFLSMAYTFIMDRVCDTIAPAPGPSPFEFTPDSTPELPNRGWRWKEKKQQKTYFASGPDGPQRLDYSPRQQSNYPAWMLRTLGGTNLQQGGRPTNPYPNAPSTTQNSVPPARSSGGFSDQYTPPTNFNTPDQLSPPTNWLGLAQQLENDDGELDDDVGNVQINNNNNRYTGQYTDMPGDSVFGTNAMRIRTEQEERIESNRRSQLSDGQQRAQTKREQLRALHDAGRSNETIDTAMPGLAERIAGQTLDDVQRILDEPWSGEEGVALNATPIGNVFEPATRRAKNSRRGRRSVPSAPIQAATGLARSSLDPSTLPRTNPRATREELARAQRFLEATPAAQEMAETDARLRREERQIARDLQRQSILSVERQQVEDAPPIRLRYTEPGQQQQPPPVQPMSLYQRAIALTNPRRAAEISGQNLQLAQDLAARAKSVENLFEQHKEDGNAD